MDEFNNLTSVHGLDLEAHKVHKPYLEAQKVTTLSTTAHKVKQGHKCRDPT